MEGKQMRKGLSEGAWFILCIAALALIGFIYNMCVSSASIKNNSAATLPVNNALVQQTSQQAQVSSTYQSSTYAEPTYKDVVNLSNKQKFQASDGGIVMVTGKYGSFMLPVVTLVGTYATLTGGGTTSPTSPPNPIKFDIPASQADELAVYCLNSVITFIGPRGWKVAYVDISADGYTGVGLVPNDGSKDWMEMVYQAGYTGPMGDDIGQWVSGMQTWASQKSGITFNSEPFLYSINFMTLGSQSVGFSYIGDPPDTTNGVTKYNVSGSNEFFSQEFITLPDSNRPLATTVLNFFLNHNGGQ
jgi:hypothetical protein